MAKVTVGVPVYNGGKLIEECLECLVSQTFRDIEILVFDNASTDQTQEVIERYAKVDSRIRYVRRSKNVGAIQNFIDPMNEATAAYFMWRAHDDISSLDYIERLYNALQRAPTARLAIGTIEHVSRDGSRTRIFMPKLPHQSIPAIEVVQLLFSSHAGWYYGLWEVATLRKLVHEVWTEFPHAWASDHLTLYPLLLDRAIAIAPEARFIQRVVVKEYTPKKGEKAPLRTMLELRQLFWNSCDNFLAERNFDRFTYSIIKIATWPYVGKRVYKLRTMLKRYLRTHFKR